jgi:hypothetical protein
MELSRNSLSVISQIHSRRSELLPSLGSSAIGDNSIRDMVRKSTSELIEKMLFAILEREFLNMTINIKLSSPVSPLCLMRDEMEI